MSESELIKRLRSGVPPLDADAAARARERIERSARSRGAFGRIATLAEQLCAIAGKLPDGPCSTKAIVIGAGDHGVAEEGVSAYGGAATADIVSDVLAGRAAINAFARACGADVFVANFGLRSAFAPHPLLIGSGAGRGTANLARRAAMRNVDVEGALAAGARALDDVLARNEYGVIALGEIGVGNTTSAAAVIAAFTGAPPNATVGRGAGIDDVTLARKRRIVAGAVGALDGASWSEIARAVGGFEIVGLAGIIFAAAHKRIPIVLDGLATAAAALIAHAIEPRVLHYCIAGQRSQEPGHRIALEALGLAPLLDLDLRMGEGGGAALALPMVEAASRLLLEGRTSGEA